MSSAIGGDDLIDEDDTRGGVRAGPMPETHSIGPRTRERICYKQSCPAAFERYRLLIAGLSDAVDGFRWVRHTPLRSQALVCYGGRGRVLVDGRWEICDEGTAYLTPPNVLQAYHAMKEGEWNICWIKYDESLGLAPVINCERPVLVRLDPRPVRAAVEGLYYECSGAANDGLIHRWVDVIHTMVRRMAEPFNQDDRLWRLWEAVDKDLGRAWTLPELARIACVSPEHLRRLTQQRFGRSPLEHVASLRMQRSASLLTHSSHKVETVARLVGYQNPFAFATAFKRWMGRSPSSFRDPENPGQPL